MRYEHFNFTDSYANAAGKDQETLALNELAKLIGQNKEALVVAMNEAGVAIPFDATPQQITSTIKANAGNEQLKHHLGGLILANAQIDEEVQSNFLGKNKAGVSRWKSTFGKGGSVGSWFKKTFKRKNPSTTPNATNVQKEKKGFLGGIFKRKMVKDPTTGEMVKGTSAAGDWFGRNADAIGSIGSSLLGGLFGKKDAESNVADGANYYGGGNQGGGQGGQGGGKSKTGRIVLFAVLGLVVIGGIVLLARRRK